ncbi:hypothetical protein [Pyxidicoccus sp. MSG2]|uniref:hypothetical protein n=1 Tax=Pyxidicoccus sp. MSG2 TaxID=2996790 RepID=UPI00227145FC|nr:hypothetical protein [Pyxidicoccus sp. MSG2]MCY1018144.1 hypothetical protein [Pyxidicoccus sp. MSG2]
MSLPAPPPNGPSPLFDAAGQSLTPRGEPAPARPAGLPEDAWLTDDARAWGTGLFKSGGLPEGLHRRWTLEGELVAVTYHAGNRRSTGSRSPDFRREGDVLVHASEQGDTEAVEALLALGFGHEPGAALEAALASQPELAKRIVSMPPGEPFQPPAAPPRPAFLPAEAVWLPSREQWVAGTVDAEQGPVGTWKGWRFSGVAPDGRPRGILEVGEFQDGRPRHERQYRTLDEHDGVLDESWLDETGRRVRRRAFDAQGGFREVESLVSGESIERWGSLPDRIGREERRDAQHALVRVQYFDEEGRPRTELLPGEGRGRTFDAQGTVVGEGPVQDGQLSGTWMLHAGDAEARELHVGGLGLGASAALGTLLPLIFQLQREPVPAFLEKAMDVEWGSFASFFDLEAETVPNLLRLMTLDNPAAIEHAFGSLSDNLFHHGSISELAGPVLPFICAITSHLRDEAALEQLLTFLSRVGTRDYNLDAANALKKAFRQRKGPGPTRATQALEEAGLEPGHGLFHLALVEHVEAWVRLSRYANPAVSEPATVLLGLADDARAAGALCELLEGRAGSPDPRMLAARMLSLHPATEASRAALERALGSEDERLRSEAARSWLRLHLPKNDRAVAVLLERAQAKDMGAVVVLTLLPAEERARHHGTLIQALRQADLTAVYGVTRAALAATRRAESSEARREVLQALLDNKRFWRLGVNADELLRGAGLPTTRAGLEALLRGEADVGAENGNGFLSAASGIDGPSVESFRREEDA